MPPPTLGFVDLRLGLEGWHLNPPRPEAPTVVSSPPFQWGLRPVFTPPLESIELPLEMKKR